MIVISWILQFSKIFGTIDSGFATFDINDIVCYLKNNYIVYLRGRDYSKNAGHAWVCDGCYFCVKGGCPTIQMV